MWMGVWLKLDKSVTGRSTGALVITLPGGLGSLERDAQPQTLTPDHIFSAPLPSVDKLMYRVVVAFPHLSL